LWLFTGTSSCCTGYGNLVPSNSIARIVCCLYSIVGIPLCLLGIVAVSDWLHAFTCWVERRIHRGGGDDDESATVARGHCCERLIGVARSVTLSCLGIIIFILLPSIAFMWYQDWSYSTAVYYSVISLSTIGFGDYVAGACSGVTDVDSRFAVRRSRLQTYRGMRYAYVQIA